MNAFDFLNKTWATIRALLTTYEEVVDEFKRFFGIEDNPFLPLAPMFRLERFVEECREDLTRWAVHLACEEAGVNINNLPIGVEDMKRLLIEMDGFDAHKIKAWVEERFLRNADEMAMEEILKGARRALPWPRPEEPEELVQGARLRLRIPVWDSDLDMVDGRFVGDVLALEKLVQVVLMGKRPSRAGEGPISRMLFENGHLFEPGRRYEVKWGPVRGFRFHKNGTFYLYFERGEQALKVAEALINAP